MYYRKYIHTWRVLSILLMKVSCFKTENTNCITHEYSWLDKHPDVYTVPNSLLLNPDMKTPKRPPNKLIKTIDIKNPVIFGCDILI